MYNNIFVFNYKSLKMELKVYLLFEIKFREKSQSFLMSNSNSNVNNIIGYSDQV